MNEVSQKDIAQRNQLLKQTVLFSNLTPETIDYQSAGHVLLIGEPSTIITLAEAIKEAIRAADHDEAPASLSLFSPNPLSPNSQVSAEAASSKNTSQNQVHHYQLDQITGFLGQFKVEVTATKLNKQFDLSHLTCRQAYFDLVIDCSESPLINSPTLPLGYLHLPDSPDSSESWTQEYQQAWQQHLQLIGHFTKTKYIELNTEVCAHANHGLIGCQRCLEICPTDAIQSIEQQIEINTSLCQGAGSCTNACPTGAIQLTTPVTETLLDYLQRLIHGYRQTCQHNSSSATMSAAPTILFYRSEQTIDLDSLAADIIPVAVEELNQVASLHYLACLAFGAKNIMLYCDEPLNTLDQQTLNREIQFTHALLKLDLTPSYTPVIKQLITQDAALLNTNLNNEEIGNFQISEPLIEPLNSELPLRQHWFNFLDHLQQFQSQIAITTEQNVWQLLNTPFADKAYGQISITEDCTLCLACVSSCPTSALTDGGHQPGLFFTEQDCVQCGLCAQACPEQVISLQPQINFNLHTRQEKQCLKQEEPFACIACGKEFATQSMIKRMKQVMAAHDAFKANPQRLMMCGDCRVRDQVEDLIDKPWLQLR